MIPFTGVDGLKLGRPYMHVGMHVRLHGTSNWAQYWLRNALDVSYPKHQDVLSHVRRGFLNSVFTNLNTLKGNHSLLELFHFQLWSVYNIVHYVEIIRIHQESYSI